jgi:hypothetical protein
LVTVASEGFDESHCAAIVTSRVVPSAKRAIADSWTDLDVADISATVTLLTPDTEGAATLAGELPLQATVSAIASKTHAVL